MERIRRIWEALKGEPRVIIHKVEIVVNGAQDPNAIASEVAHILSSWRRTGPRAEA